MNEWVEILDNHLIGLLNGNNYLEFLENTVDPRLTEILENDDNLMENELKFHIVLLLCVKMMYLKTPFTLFYPFESQYYLRKILIVLTVWEAQHHNKCGGNYGQYRINVFRSTFVSEIYENSTYYNYNAT